MSSIKRFLSNKILRIVLICLTAVLLIVPIVFVFCPLPSSGQTYAGITHLHSMLIEMVACGRTIDPQTPTSCVIAFYAYVFPVLLCTIIAIVLDVLGFVFKPDSSKKVMRLISVIKGGVAELAIIVALVLHMVSWLAATPVGYYWGIRMPFYIIIICLMAIAILTNGVSLFDSVLSLNGQIEVKNEPKETKSNAVEEDPKPVEETVSKEPIASPAAEESESVPAEDIVEPAIQEEPVKKSKKDKPAELKVAEMKVEEPAHVDVPIKEGPVEEPVKSDDKLSEEIKELQLRCDSLEKELQTLKNQLSATKAPEPVEEMKEEDKPGFVSSDRERDKVIKRLKSLKILLNNGLISQEQYDSELNKCKNFL